MPNQHNSNSEKRYGSVLNSILLGYASSSESTSVGTYGSVLSFKSAKSNSPI